MDKQLQDFDQLTPDAAKYLRSVHGFSTWTIGYLFDRFFFSIGQDWDGLEAGF